MVVGSPDNFGRTRELGFSVQGFKSRQRRKVLEQMSPGDNLVYYVSKAQAFGATARIESDGYEDHEVIWQSKPGEDYPWRVKIAPDVVLDEADWIPSEAIGPGPRLRPEVAGGALETGLSGQPSPNPRRGLRSPPGGYYRSVEALTAQYRCPNPRKSGSPPPQAGLKQRTRTCR